MKFAAELKQKNFRLYPKGDLFLLYYKGKEWGMYSERQIAGLLRDWNKPATKPRVACKSPRPGCPCCDMTKADVKKFDKRARRRMLIDVDGE